VPLLWAAVVALDLQCGHWPHQTVLGGLNKEPRCSIKNHLDREKYPRIVQRYLERFNLEVAVEMPTNASRNRTSIGKLKRANGPKQN
jgi:hypothetical protein